MSLFVIGDLHLSGSAEKPMDIFPGWGNYTQKLCENWKNTVSAEDAVVLAGDISWGMTLDEALADFKLIDSLPGEQKFILKGNHDYWWNSASKMQGFFDKHGLSSLKILHNNAYETQGFCVCGSRGWIFENGKPHDEKIINREAARIEASLKASEGMAGERILFLHYPPVYAGQELTVYIDLMLRYGIKRCYYGHIHGAGHRGAVKGCRRGVDFSLVSADFLEFCPIEVKRAE